MSVIRLKIKKQISINIRLKKIPITCWCDSLPELKQLSVFSRLLRKLQLETNLNYSHLKYSSCTFLDPRDRWRIFIQDDRKYNVQS